MLVGGLRPFSDTHRMRAASGNLGAGGALLEDPPPPPPPKVPLPCCAAEVMRNDVPMGREHAGSGHWKPKLRA